MDVNSCKVKTNSVLPDRKMLSCTSRTHLHGPVFVGQLHLSQHLSPLLHDQGPLISVVRDLVIRLHVKEIQRKGRRGGKERDERRSTQQNSEGT